ncbi:blasticidin-S acetyltransferase [endosymbiont of Acanthamoeba sp. UWC8]|uniref:GNAT family N-acetyltransferase n=1 Tax=endosymbiont of Acanthamoeba sp. UWC8 TaxID=86106 RepID=UPI0004D11C34|nr:GNAT family N-acetyltransferase [endosymbiont of Acanthamoeba sp. UWC8]AIF81478.1 blasticidin-S acetyltransferase [endosymbiont of Acanthamoeba sp. UWC8]
MDNELKIILDKAPTEQDLEFLSEGLDKDTFNKIGIEKLEENIALFIKDETGNMYGGLSMILYLGCIYIRDVFVAEIIRNRGFATRLIHKAEAIAKENNCGFLALHTHQWQARGLYEKLGFKLKYIESGYKLNSELYYMVKIINPDCGYNFKIS